MHVDGRIALRLGIAAVCGAIVVAALWRTWSSRRADPARRGGVTDASSGAAGSGAASASAPASPSASRAAPSLDAGGPAARRITMLRPDERRRMAERIAAARARRAAAAATAPTAGAASGSAPMSTPQHVLDELLAAVPEIEAYAQECVEDHGPAAGFRARLALTGDPDVGTLIDAPSLTAPDGTTLAPAFADCVRDRIATMSLRPLETGTEFSVDLEFLFDAAAAPAP